MTTTILSIADLLRHIPLFSNLGAEQLRQLSMNVTKERFKKNSLIVNQGEKSEALHVFLNGRAHVLRKNKKGAEVIISILHAGDFIGEMSLIDNKPQSASVRAETDADILVLDRRKFVELMPEPSSVADGILMSLINRLRYANEQIESLALMDVNGRMARMLLELAEYDAGGELTIRTKPSIQDLAKMIGSSREAASRVLKLFTERGFLEIDSDNHWHLRTDIRTLT